MSRCAVPHKPEAYTNLVNSIRWTAMAPKVQKAVGKGLVVHAAQGNSTAAAQNLHPPNALRRLHDAPAGDASGNGALFASSSVPQEWTGDEELTALMEPADAYRTVITMAALFCVIVAAHACMLRRSMLHTYASQSLGFLGGSCCLACP
jgi:hypothetical protein